MTENDPDTLGSGDPNEFQNFPVILSAAEIGPALEVGGTLESTPNTPFELDFYSNTVVEPLGHGEGEGYLGSGTVTTVLTRANAAATMSEATA